VSAGQPFGPGAGQQFLLGGPRSLGPLDLAAYGFRFFIALAEVFIDVSPMRQIVRNNGKDIG
jgi:hypothetical protein